MIEFVLSRVTLMACGMGLLMVAVAVIDAVHEDTIEEMEEDLADDIARLLDSIDDDDPITLTLHGSDILPDHHHSLKVHDHVVEVTNGEDMMRAVTSSEMEFELEYGEVITISSVTESLGDVDDSIGEHIDLFRGIVKIHRCTSASINSP